MRGERVNVELTRVTLTVITVTQSHLGTSDKQRENEHENLSK